MQAGEFTILALLKTKALTLEDLSLAKRKASKQYGVPCPPNSELLAEYHKLLRNKRIKLNAALESLLRKRKIRSLSGVAVVSVLTRPYPCGGKCLYCPTQPGVPKSYLDKEPAVMRALLHKYDPYEQVQERVKALEANGHPTDKVDLRIIGGTWTYNPKWYQTWFITRCFAACNAKQAQNPCLGRGPRKTTRKTKRLAEEQGINERARHRIVGINIETRPDTIDLQEIRRLRKLGVTQVELGVQSLYDDVLDINKRGHRIDAVGRATKLLKDTGFKICYHMMPNLPGSTPKKDVQMFKELFSNPAFQPDHLKIYPCALLKEAPLYWMKDRIGYRPYSAQKLLKIIKAAKKYIPYYCRIQRIMRDIPANYIMSGGTKVSNLRELVQREIKKEGWQCKCIRCREVKADYDPSGKLQIFRQDYEASGGREIFLSFENKDRTKLYSLLRLRIPANVIASTEICSPHAFQVLKDTALIREVHTYGQLHPIEKSQTSLNSPQHKGLGRALILEAEKIARQEFGLKRVAVISAVGTREYYRKWGYRLQDTYMVKNL